MARAVPLGWARPRALARMGLLLCLLGCGPILPPTLVPLEQLVYHTSDGWEAPIRHYPAPGPPVLLVHGMGVNHYNWDYREEVSLAHYLQGQGFDVWVPELRGDPGSIPPDRRAWRRYTVSDHAQLDLPAAVEVVLQATRREDLLWVGHSMGGILLYAALRRAPDQIRAGVALGAPVHFEVQHGLQHLARAMGWTLVGHWRLPGDGMGNLSAGVGRISPLYGMVANRRNLDWAIARGLARHALVDLPTAMMRQGLGWLKARAIEDADGEPWAQPDPTPLLVMGGAADRVVPPENVAHACVIYPDCRYFLLGTERGFAVDYGHVDMLLGKTAPREIYPLISDFLRAQSQEPRGLEPSKSSPERADPPAEPVPTAGPRPPAKVPAH